MLLEALFLGIIAGERMQQNAAARQVAVWDTQLKQMDVWDGIEHQIREHCNFYDKKILPRQKYFVRFGGDKSKYRHISMVDVAANKDFWNSGLSATDYAIKYFRAKFEEDPQWEKAHEVYRSDFTLNKDLNLFDRNGNETHFSLSYCYSNECDNADQHRCLSWWGASCETDSIIFPICP